MPHSLVTNSVRCASSSQTAGHVVLPDAATEERERLFAVDVLRQRATQMALQIVLGGERGRERERTREAMVGGDLDEQLLGVGHADGVEQLLAQLRRRVRHVRMCHVETFMTMVLPGAV